MHTNKYIVNKLEDYKVCYADEANQVMFMSQVRGRTFVIFVIGSEFPRKSGKILVPSHPLTGRAATW